MATILLAAVALVIVGPLSSAQAQASDFTLTVAGEDGRAVIALSEVSLPISTLTGALRFDEGVLGQADCEVLVGLGACNDRGGRVEFALVAVTALSVPADLVEITFTHSDFDGSVQLLLVDVEAGDPSGAVLRSDTVSADLTGESSRWLSRSTWVVGGIVVVVAAAAVARRVASTISDNHAERG